MRLCSDPRPVSLLHLGRDGDGHGIGGALRQRPKAPGMTKATAPAARAPRHGARLLYGATCPVLCCSLQHPAESNLLLPDGGRRTAKSSPIAYADV
eukprot:366418-Chlamydomonas_euryale.AAC.1